MRFLERIENLAGDRKGDFGSPALLIRETVTRTRAIKIETDLETLQRSDAECAVVVVMPSVKQIDRRRVTDGCAACRKRRGAAAVIIQADVANCFHKTIGAVRVVNRPTAFYVKRAIFHAR